MDIRMIFTYAVIMIGTLIMLKYRAQLKRDMDVLDPRNWPASYRSHDSTYWTAWIVTTLLLVMFAFCLIQATAITVHQAGIPLMDQSEDVVVQALDSGNNLTVAILITYMILVVPLEEWIFRHMLFRHLCLWMDNRPMPKGLSFDGIIVHITARLLLVMAVSSFAFALIHLTNNGALLGVLIPHFVAGMLFCAVYIAGGFSMTIAVHLGHNLLLIYLLLAR